MGITPVIRMSLQGKGIGQFHNMAFSFLLWCLLFLQLSPPLFCRVSLSRSGLSISLLCFLVVQDLSRDSSCYLVSSSFVSPFTTFSFSSVLYSSVFLFMFAAAPLTRLCLDNGISSACPFFGRSRYE
jgi:hypothetical protein